jgi:hypothetical protein
MMNRMILALAALGLAACQTPCPAPDTGSIVATYRCADGSDIQVTFSRAPDAALIVQEGYSPVSLPLRSSAVGFRYTDNGAELQGRRSEVHWTRPGASETLCRERTGG